MLILKSQQNVFLCFFMFKSKISPEIRWRKVPLSQDFHSWGNSSNWVVILKTIRKVTGLGWTFFFTPSPDCSVRCLTLVNFIYLSIELFNHCLTIALQEKCVVLMKLQTITCSLPLVQLQLKAITNTWKMKTLRSFWRQCDNVSFWNNGT